jgi:hypothetical protein
MVRLASTLPVFDRLRRLPPQLTDGRRRERDTFAAPELDSRVPSTVPFVVFRRSWPKAFPARIATSEIAMVKKVQMLVRFIMINPGFARFQRAVR